MTNELKTGHELLSELEAKINEWIKEAENLQKRALEYSRIVGELKQENHNYVESLKGWPVKITEPLAHLYPNVTSIIESTMWASTEAGFYDWSEFHTKMLSLENQKPWQYSKWAESKKQ